MLRDKTVTIVDFRLLETSSALGKGLASGPSSALEHLLSALLFAIHQRLCRLTLTHVSHLRPFEREERFCRLSKKSARRRFLVLDGLWP